MNNIDGLNDKNMHGDSEDDENENDAKGDCKDDTETFSDANALIPKSFKDNIEMIQRSFQNIYSSEILQQFQQTNKLFQETTKPFVEASRLASEAMRSFTPIQIPDIPEDMLRIADVLSNLPQLYTPTIKINLPDLHSIQIESSLAAAVAEMQETISAAFESPVIKWMNNFDWSSVFQPIIDLPSIHIDSKQFKKLLLQVMYDEHWFPGVIWEADFSLFTDVINIIEHTRVSKNRTHKIDKSIFAYYTDDKVEEIKKSWRNLGLPEYLMRLLHQCVQAYHRKEYGITVIVLSTQWEGIICYKVNRHHEWRRQDKTSGFLHNLADENDYPEIFKSYYDDFITYTCRSPQDTIPDVPGRNSAAHSFYNTYPSKKAALNAILFTNFLLNLNSSQEVPS